MFEEQNEKALETLKKQEENVTSIINGKISSINQGLDKLTLDINNNLIVRLLNGVNHCNPAKNDNKLKFGTNVL